jgi:predicted secreted protein
MNALVRVRNGLWAMALVMLAGCAAGDKLKPVATQPLIKAVGQQSLTVTEAQAGAGIELGREQELIVRLTTVGTSGREWSLVDLAPGVLVATGPKFQRALIGTTDDDSSGQSIWRLRPSAAGSVSLRFEYRRPRNTEAAAAVVTYAVTVQ